MSPANAAGSGGRPGKDFMSSYFGTFLSAQIWQVPYLVVYVTGLVFALVGKRQGKFQGLAAWGFGLLLLTWLFQAINQYLLYTRVDRGLAAFGSLSSLSWFALPLVHLIGIVLVGAAVFADRQTRA